jgi:hypothetical protein
MSKKMLSIESQYCFLEEFYGQPYSHKWKAKFGVEYTFGVVRNVETPLEIRLSPIVQMVINRKVK